MDASDAVAFGDDLDRAAAAGGLDGARGELRLDLFHLLLHSRSLFHEFADAGHSLRVYELRVELLGWKFRRGLRRSVPLKISSAF